MLSEDRRKIVVEDEEWSDEIPCVVDSETTLVDGFNGIFQKLFNRIYKVKNMLNDKQNKTDNTLLTTLKTVVGAINEILGLTNTNKSAILNNTEQIENLYGHLKEIDTVVFASTGIQTHTISNISNPNNILLVKIYNSKTGRSDYGVTDTRRGSILFAHHNGGAAIPLGNVNLGSAVIWNGLFKIDFNGFDPTGNTTISFYELKVNVN